MRKIQRVIEEKRLIGFPPGKQEILNLFGDQGWSPLLAPLELCNSLSLVSPRALVSPLARIRNLDVLQRNALSVAQ